MKNIVVLLVSSAALMTGPVFAGVEIQAKRMMTEKVMVEELAKVKSACSNTTLRPVFDWSQWDSYDFKAERLDEVRTTGWIGGLINDIYDDMVELCTTTELAELYKTEFQRIETIQFAGHQSIKSRKSKFSLANDGKVLKVSLNPNAAYNSATLKFIKQAWN